jgi:NAD(P)-dependent dehydrogenase (short-subunit alcohol dehydrogenase family)
MGLRGKVALVTAARSCVGAATALRLAREGARVGALGHTEDEPHETVGRIRAAGGEATALPADVADAPAMQRAVDRLVATYGRLDVVVANAGINGVWAPIDELEPAEFDRPHDRHQPPRQLPHPALRGAAPEARRRRINGGRLLGQRHAHVHQRRGDRVRLQQGRGGGARNRDLGQLVATRTEAAMVPAGYPAGRIPLTGGAPGRELILFLASERSRHITGTPVWIDGAESLLVG